MTRKRYTEEQTINILKEAEAGARVGDLCRRYGMSNASFYNILLTKAKGLKMPKMMIAHAVK
jgi:putative transposase